MTIVVQQLDIGMMLVHLLELTCKSLSCSMFNLP